MSLTQALISEIKHEAESTKKLLALVPAEKFNWRPHPKSTTLKGLASHVAGLAVWPALVCETPFLDLAGGALKKVEVNNAYDLVNELNEGVEKSIAALNSSTDEALKTNWALRKGDHVILDVPKAVAIRGMALNHLYHHRAQLSVYLRLLDIPIPGMYGPSADDIRK